MLLFPLYPPDTHYPLRGYASSVCPLHIIRLFYTHHPFALLLPSLSSKGLYCESKGLCYVPKGLYCDAKGLHQQLKDIPQQSNFPNPLPPSTPLFMGDSGWKVYNRTFILAQNAPSFRVKQTVCFLPTDYAFSLNGQCVFLRAYVQKSVLLRARIY